MIGYRNVVCLSVTLCTVAKRYILQRKCLNQWIGSALLGTRRYDLQPPTPTWFLKDLHGQLFTAGTTTGQGMIDRCNVWPCTNPLLFLVFNFFLRVLSRKDAQGRDLWRLNRKCPTRNTTVQPSTSYTDLIPQTPNPQHFQRSTIGCLSNSWASCYHC